MGTQFPFAEQGGVFKALDAFLPSNNSAQAVGLNNAGAVVGFFIDTGGVTHGI